MQAYGAVDPYNGNDCFIKAKKDPRFNCGRLRTAISGGRSFWLGGSFKPPPN
ncbi:hypothetical protein FACS189490_08090 [Clostridia bacterium]|nr:hypothetical protein FACS189490_08090 [Clostridia bacterium]